MAVMQHVGTQDPLIANRLSCTEPLMRITRSLPVFSSAGQLVILLVKLWLCENCLLLTLTRYLYFSNYIWMSELMSFS